MNQTLGLLVPWPWTSQSPQLWEINAVYKPSNLQNWEVREPTNLSSCAFEVPALPPPHLLTEGASHTCPSPLTVLSSKAPCPDGPICPSLSALTHPTTHCYLTCSTSCSSSPSHLWCWLSSTFSFILRKLPLLIQPEPQDTPPSNAN